jgi:sulfofructose kinase
MANEIIAVGMACYDHVVVVPDFEEVPRGCRALDVVVQGGGVAATAAVAARALGALSQLWVRVGADSHGEYIVADLRRRGIDTSELQMLQGARTAISTVLVEKPSGDRRFLYYPGINSDEWEDPDYSRIDRSQALIVDGRWPGVCLAAVRRARAHAVPVICDLGHGSPEEMQILHLADYPIISEVAYCELAGAKALEDFADELLAGHAQAVIFTHGERGVWLKEREGRAKRLGVFDVEVADTTGAGDVFHGAFAYFITTGHGVEESALLSSAASAHACTALGCRGAIASMDDVMMLATDDRRPTWGPVE